jgi:glycogen debranching enzyme
MTIASTLSKLAPKGLKLPTSGSITSNPTTPGGGGGAKTPKTPQDEALAYFSSEESHTGEPVQVWELWLEDDGGPDERKSVSWSVSHLITWHGMGRRSLMSGMGV